MLHTRSKLLSANGCCNASPTCRHYSKQAGNSNRAQRTGWAWLSTEHLILRTGMQLGVWSPLTFAQTLAWNHMPTCQQACCICGSKHHQAPHLEAAPVAQASRCTQLVGTSCLHGAECDALRCAPKLAADVAAAAADAAADVDHLQQTGHTDKLRFRMSLDTDGVPMQGAAPVRRGGNPTAPLRSNCL